jgi:hypothetical protein
VNNQEICAVTDPEPLTGSNRTAVGLLGWIADKREGLFIVTRKNGSSDQVRFVADRLAE